MTESVDFGFAVLIVSLGFALALVASWAASRLPIPAPALFLVFAAVASDVWTRLGHVLAIRDVERIAVVALIVILFDGGMQMGWRRFRTGALPIVALGTVGTVLTAVLMAGAARWLFGFSWLPAFVLAAALSPTDPAVVFSVLGGKEIEGRSGTILEGESGANDPVSIALMLGLLDMASKHASGWIVVKDFAIEMGVGVAIGVAGGFALLRLMRRRLPNEGLYALRAFAAAGVVYGAASVAHGSGFVAVFAAGIVVGDVKAPHWEEIERFSGALASTAEIVVFAALGLTINLSSLGLRSVWLDGLVLALLLAFVARPLATAPLLLPVRLSRGERLFVIWAGLKGAVPVLLGTFALLGGLGQGERIYGIVFVVVLFSVVVQGGSLPWIAGRLGVPMRSLRRPS